MSTEDKEISWWVEVSNGERVLTIQKYSDHDWSTVLRSIADSYDEQHKLPTNDTESINS